MLECHKKSTKLCTLTTVQREERFGVLTIEDDSSISNFQEKPKNKDSWINGGFFVCEPEVFDYIPDGDNAIWEQEPLQSLAQSGQLNAFKHHGFWHPMDTLKDKEELNKLWLAGNAPWKVWAERRIG